MPKATFIELGVCIVLSFKSAREASAIMASVIMVMQCFLLVWSEHLTRDEILILYTYSFKGSCDILFIHIYSLKSREGTAKHKSSCTFCGISQDGSTVVFRCSTQC